MPRPTRTGDQLRYAAALHQAGDIGRAAQLCDRILKDRPRDPDALRLLGVIKLQRGDLDEAQALISKSIKYNRDSADAHYLLGRIFWQKKLKERAAFCLEQCIKLNPKHEHALNIRGCIASETGQPEQAVELFKRTVAINPRRLDAWYNYAAALLALRRFDEALACLEQARAAAPDTADAHYLLGTWNYEYGRRNQALAHFERALALKPNYGEVELALCIGQLPILYMDDAEIDACRAAYAERLAALCQRVEQSGRYRDFTQAVGSIQPFLLAYQGRNNRSLQARYGSLMCRIMRESYPPVPIAVPPGPGERVRVGFVSSFYRSNHSVWKIPIKGWLEQLDPSEFQVLCYHTGSSQDAAITRAAAVCDRVVQGPMSMDRWRQIISSDAPHVLIYPEVGMERVTAQLAAQRLAPVQCIGGGHPDTSGFPTLDYYLSSDLMEPLDAQEHYTERLVRLSNLSVYYEPLGIPTSSLARSDSARAQLGLRATATVYWCCQSLYKYLPQFDQVFPRIAREVGDCQFAFIEYQISHCVTELFRQRLDRAFLSFGLKADEYCVVLARQDQQGFLAAAAQSDIFLDSIGWNGNNSTLESLSSDLPIVTLTGPLMRGRHSTAILAMMGVTETIAATVDDYISIAVRLALDVQWRTAVRRRVAESKHRVYRDRSCVVALGEFLKRVARNGGRA
jgi:protein O-GlcNAc transferase